MMKKFMAISMVVIFVLTSLVGCGSGEETGKPVTEGPTETQTPETDGGVIRIGALFPYTGSLAELGVESFRGLELATNKINAEGGINGKKIELVKGDAVDTAAAVSETERLIQKEGLNIIAGTYSSSLSMAASQVAEQNKKIFFELGAVATDITDRGFKYLFRTCDLASGNGNTAATFLMDVAAPEIGVSLEDLRVVILHEDSQFGTAVTDAFYETCTEAGVNIVERISYTQKTNDMSSIVMKTKEAKPHCIYIVSYLNDGALFVNQSIELKLDIPIFISGGAGFGLTTMIDAIGPENMKGIFNSDFPQFNVNEDATPGLDEYIAAYQETYGTLPRSGHSTANYVGAQFLFEAIKNAGSDDPDAIREAALNLDIPMFQTVNGWGCKFDDKGNNIRGMHYMHEWTDKEQFTVWPDDVATGEPTLPFIPWYKR